jgi:hypothetical protein
LEQRAGRGSGESAEGDQATDVWSGRVTLAASANFVYVEGNDPAGNAIFAFARNDTDGSLAQIPGSPFSAGGLGITFATALGPFELDQAIIFNSTDTLLFAVNGGSDTIAVFNINVDGSLVPVAGSPFPSGGSNPVSVGLSNDNPDPALDDLH